MVNGVMSRESEPQSVADVEVASPAGDEASANLPESAETQTKKRHVIKAKNLKPAALDRTVENTSSLAKGIDFIQKISKRHKPTAKSKGEQSACKETNTDSKKTENEHSRQEKSSADATLPEISRDTSSSAAIKSKTSHEGQAADAGTAMKKKSMSQKVFKKDKTNQSRKRAPKSSVKSHVLTEYYPVRRSSRKTKSLIEKEQNDMLLQAIESKCEDGLSVMEFKEKGRGVIAKRAFKKGSFVVEYAGELIDWNEAKERERDYSRDPSVGCYMYYFVYGNINYCIDATAESGRLGRLLNHSRKNPNCKTKLVPVSDADGKDTTAPRLIIVAKRDISAGEELMYDYGDRDKETMRLHPWLKSA